MSFRLEMPAAFEPSPTLDDAIWKGVEAHMGSCPRCAAHAEKNRKLLEEGVYEPVFLLPGENPESLRPRARQ